MAFLARQGMPTAARSIHREHVEAFIAAELERTAPSSAATRYRSLRQLFGSWTTRARSTGHRWPRRARRRSPRNRCRFCPTTTCGGYWPTVRARTSFRDRRDLAIVRLFLDTGMRLEGMAGLRYNADDPEASDVDLRSRVVRFTAKGRRELVFPIGTKAARDIDRYTRVSAGHPHAADAWLWLGTKGPTHVQWRLPDDQRPTGHGWAS